MKEELKVKWNTLDNELKFILGRPNFMCAGIANRLREMGYECERKAEAEQALVLHTMITFYEADKNNWKENLEKYLKEKGEYMKWGNLRPTKPCPNCGELNFVGALIYSATANYSPEYASTIYGVCKDCAERHKQIKG
jgi:hypothetical protein